MNISFRVALVTAAPPQPPPPDTHANQVGLLRERKDLHTSYFYFFPSPFLQIKRKEKDIKGFFSSSFLTFFFFFVSFFPSCSQQVSIHFEFSVGIHYESL